MSKRQGTDQGRACNTALATYNKVGQGIDTMHLTYYGFPSEDALGTLNAIRISPSIDPQSFLVDVAGQTLKVSPHGMGRFYYALRNEYFVVKLSRPTLSKFPCAQVQIKSAAFFKYGYDRSLRFANDIVNHYCSVDSISLSRLDIYMDIETDYSFKGASRLNFVSRAKAFALYHYGTAFTGVSVGLGSEVSFRLYDKLLEASQQNKAYWITHYKDCQNPVWRCEFQLSGFALRQYDITYQNHLDKLPSLWAYLSGKWLRHVDISHDDSNNRRWCTSSFWSFVSQAFSGADVQPLQRIKQVRTPETVNKVVKRAISAIASFSVGGSYRDFSEVLLDFIDKSQAVLQTDNTTLLEHFNIKRSSFSGGRSIRCGYMPLGKCSSIYDALLKKEKQYDIPF